MERIDKELLAAALQCKNTDELMELAKSKGYDITQEQAESFLGNHSSNELDDKELDDVSGGAWKHDQFERSFKPKSEKFF